VPKAERNQPTAKAGAARELLPIQQLIADEVSDMLVHGGHESDVELLVLGVSAIIRKRLFLDIGRDAALLGHSA
jgi:hypothetical protein